MLFKLYSGFFFSMDSILVDLYELIEPSEGLEWKILMDLAELIDWRDFTSFILTIPEVRSLFDVETTLLGPSYTL